MTAQEAITQVDSILPYARVWARRASTNFDDEICQTLAAGLLDLQNAGVVRLDIRDPLIQQAEKLYLKANFGSDPNADKFAQAYGYLKASLSLSGDYNGGAQIDP